jgi:dTMP kinase
MSHNISLNLDFKRNPHKGTYIALEGIDGSGKTFQTDALETYFKKKGHEVLIAREPRKENSPLSNVINDVLTGKIKFSPLAIQYLFTTDRIMNQEEIILPALEAGKTVIADRSFWSIIPYALSDLKLDFNDENTYFLLLSQGILSSPPYIVVPDKIFFLDISVETAMQRLSHRSEEKEIYEKKSKITKHHKGYHWLRERFPEEFKVIDGECSEEEVTKKILQELKKIK